MLNRDALTMSLKFQNHLCFSKMLNSEQDDEECDATKLIVAMQLTHKKHNVYKPIRRRK